jgi:hypothetical protein
MSILQHYTPQDRFLTGNPQKTYFRAICRKCKKYVINHICNHCNIKNILKNLAIKRHIIEYYLLKEIIIN